MRQISVGTNLTPSVKTTVYTVPTGYYALWNLLYVINHTGGNKTVDVWWYDASTNTEVTILASYTLNADQYIKFDGSAYIVLEEGDQIRITADAASQMSAVNTFEVIRKA